MARLKALKVELQELKSPVHSPGKASEDAGEALSKTKDELKKETVRCEQLQQEKDEATREVAALHAQVEALRRAKSLPSTQEQAASKKLHTEVTELESALKEAQKKERQRSAEVMKLRSELIRAQQGAPSEKRGLSS